MKTLRRFFSDLKKYRAYIIYSAKAKLKADVAESRLNWIWWVLEPLCMMLVYTFVFGVIFKGREENFPLFIFIGLTLWNFFSGNVKQSVRMVKRYKGIITKIYVPKIVLNLSHILVTGFKMMISLAIVAVMMLLFRVQLSFCILFIIPVLAILMLLTFGIMCIFMHLGVALDDLANVTDIVLRLMFYVTGVFFDINVRIGSSYPRLAVILGKVNPMAFLMTSAREALLYGQVPDLLWMGVWLLAALVLDMIGIYVVYKNENSYAKSI